MAAMPEGVLLDPGADVVESGVGEADHVEVINDEIGVGKLMSQCRDLGQVGVDDGVRQAVGSSSATTSPLLALPIAIRALKCLLGHGRCDCCLSAESPATEAVEYCWRELSWPPKVTR